jgi:hypothetical protein
MYRKNRLARFNTRKGLVYLSTDDRKRQRQLRRLQTELVPTSEPETLTAQAAVCVLVEYIKEPNASDAQLSKAVGKVGVKASPEAIARLFREHDLKKTPV